MPHVVFLAQYPRRITVVAGLAQYARAGYLRAGVVHITAGEIRLNIMTRAAVRAGDYMVSRLS